MPHTYVQVCPCKDCERTYAIAMVLQAYKAEVITHERAMAVIRQLTGKEN